MTRGGSEESKGKRTKSRHQQIMELYSKCEDEDVRDLKHQLESMGEYVDNKLQADRVFLYFMQFGKSAYSRKSIELEKLMSGSSEYDVDHIYPQAYVKDDSIINNKVLVLSTENEEKQDIYPIKASIRAQMHATWTKWHHIGVISDEKYRRLTRATGFTEDEKFGFINRQLTETSQSTKAVAQILKEKYPETEIVYTRAKLASDFRHVFGLYKSRSFNDLHHAVDAYLNIVTGNVYNARFSKRFFDVNLSYSVKTKTLFTHDVKFGNEVVWKHDVMLNRVRKTAKKNTAHFVKYSFFKTGGLFDQMPVKKTTGLVPLKKGLPTEKYGGYNKATTMFFIPVRYRVGKKAVLYILPVELMYGKKVISDKDFAKEYAINRLSRLLNKNIEDVSFPLGMRPLKMNTVLSLDGFRVCITGKDGDKIIIRTISQFCADYYWMYYLSKVERFVNKFVKNPKYIYDADYDEVNETDNLKLYDLYVDKLKGSFYCKRQKNPVAIVENGRDAFLKMNIIEQAKTLLEIQKVFGRFSTVNLTAIGGNTKAGETTLSLAVSNWKKYYKDVRIVDQSPSGMWEKVSRNILDYV